MNPFAAMGGGGGGFSQSGSADTGPVSGSFGGFSIGGINTGQQGLDMTTLAVLGGIVVLALFILRK